jgi:hypothetical protein
MEFTVHKQPLSALHPVKFTYSYNSEETLDGELNSYNGDFSFYTHQLLSDFKDASLSKQTCVVLTDTKSLNSVFKKSITPISIETTSGSVYLKTEAGLYWKIKEKNIFIGGTGDKLIVTVVQIRDNIVELHVGRKGQYLKIDNEYPYTLSISDISLTEENSSIKRFELDYKNKKLTLKAFTPEGRRFLSYGKDKVVRAVGLELNDVVINPYVFEVDFVTAPYMVYNTDSDAKEIKYFNELTSVASRSSLDIKSIIKNDTHLLVSCPTKDLSQSSLSSVKVNIAMMKTNFSSSGSFIPST